MTKRHVTHVGTQLSEIETKLFVVYYLNTATHTDIWFNILAFICFFSGHRMRQNFLPCILLHIYSRLYLLCKFLKWMVLTFDLFKLINCVICCSSHSYFQRLTLRVKYNTNTPISVGWKYSVFLLIIICFIERHWDSVSSVISLLLLRV